MSFEMMVGLLVIDHDRYAQYREAITPLLATAGGKFRYDFEVARVLKTEADCDMNRVFVISFPDRSSKERFFSDSDYRKVRARLYETAVAGTTILAEYDTSESSP
jgi:uncharacterized protein (DUF1330 family)